MSILYSTSWNQQPGFHLNGGAFFERLPTKREWRMFPLGGWSRQTLLVMFVDSGLGNVSWQGCNKTQKKWRIQAGNKSSRRHGNVQLGQSVSGLELWIFLGYFFILFHNTYLLLPAMLPHDDGETRRHRRHKQLSIQGKDLLLLLWHLTKVWYATISCWKKCGMYQNCVVFCLKDPLQKNSAYESWL